MGMMREEGVSQRELIVVAAENQEFTPNLASLEQRDDSLAELGARRGIRIEPLFEMSSSRLLARLDAAPAVEEASARRMPRYFAVKAPDEDLDSLARELAELPEVEAAYVKPAAEPPFIGSSRLTGFAPEAAPPAPVVTPDFRLRQAYLGPAPVGIDARHAWTLAGGKGAGINVIDCEWGWNFSHEDLLLNQGGIVIGPGSTADNHGTAVVGIISADEGASGCTGIAPEAHISAAAFVGIDSVYTAPVIRRAADRLSPGDILLLEAHRPGPNANRGGQFGYIPIEWWPDDFDAIRYAVARGIIVVEAAGNGSQDLDDAVYAANPIFPASWRNPFNVANPSSGAILVGAGNPPPGTHGVTVEPGWNETYVDRARCVFSNYGARVDCQGWGWQVTTTGYGDLQGGTNRQIWYTDVFGGTSSASPIVVGALACIQGVLRAASRGLLDSPRATQLLRATGSPQAGAPNRPVTQRIGNRPDIRAMLNALQG